VTRQDQRFPDLHEPAEGGLPKPPAGTQAPLSAPRFAEIFAPAPELTEEATPAVRAEEQPQRPKSAGSTRSSEPATSFIDDENPLGPASDRVRGVRRGRDAGASFEDLVAEMFPAEEAPLPALLVEEPRGSRRRWVALAILVLAVGAGAYHFRGHLFSFFRSGGEPGGAVGSEGLGRLPAATAAVVETEVPTEVPPSAPSSAVIPQSPPAPKPVDPATLVPATRISSVRWETVGEGGVVVLQADGGVVPRRIRHLRLEDPPRELVRISGILGLTEPDSVNVGGTLVSRIRLGHHPELSPPELYVVIDLATTKARGATPEPSGDTVRIAVR